MENLVHYAASKHGVIGIMRTLALELGPHFIRVNALLPGTVNTPMIRNEPCYRLFRPDLDNPTVEDLTDRLTGRNSLPIRWVEPIDVSNALLFLASDEGRYITGVPLPIDSGSLNKS
jgi:NAD(P)-dependent dehydrogenase (short-subunit alcohol dehydrogenase family)